MGPSWTDPRSGEIIQASVYMYHDVLKLLHNWKFVQTAQVDPKARAAVFDEETMGASLRYVAPFPRFYYKIRNDDFYHGLRPE